MSHSMVFAMLSQRLRPASALATLRHGDYYILESVISLKDEKEPERAALIMNHLQLYVKTFRRGMQWIRQVAIHNANVQREELDLLEKHLGGGM
jgi:hypothetical protein